MEQKKTKRWADVIGLCDHTSMGRCRAVEFAKTHGAVVKVGKRNLFDLQVIDQALEEMRNQQNGN